MTTQKKDGAGEKKSRVNIGKLRVNKETVKDLTDKEAEQIKGGGKTLFDACQDSGHPRNLSAVATACSVVSACYDCVLLQ